MSMIAPTALAGTLRVPGDFPSILSAVDAAVPGDSILVGPGVWTDREERLVTIGSPVLVTSCAFLKGGLTIVGEMGAQATVIDAGGFASSALIALLWAWYPGEELTLDGLTIKGGNADGVLAYVCGTLTIKNCSVVENVSTAAGGEAIQAYDCNLVLHDSEVSRNIGHTGTGTTCLASGFSFVDVRRCRFEDNFESALGLVGSFANMIVEDCVFARNRSASGAGLTITGGSGETPTSTVTVTGNLFWANAIENNGSGAGARIDRALLDMRFNTFAYDSCGFSSVGAGLSLSSRVHGIVQSNTFVGCHSESNGATVQIGNLGVVEFKENIVAFSTGGPAVRAVFDPVLTGGCNLYWGNEGGNYSEDWPAFASDVLADPEFCDVNSFDLSVAASSPCAPGGTPGCGPIGAWGVGCGTVNVEATSWGRIKSLYR